MSRIITILLSILVCGCAPTASQTPTIVSTPINLATLSEGCATGGTIIPAALPEPARGYPYTYRVYLPPCFSTESPELYPVLYLIPGRSSSPDSWLKAGLPEEVDRLILAGEVPPFIIVSTETTEADSQAETIYKELIPTVESQFPIATDRRYRAVAGGSLGGIAAYRLAFQYPDTFSSAGIFGAGVIPGEETQVRLWLSRTEETNRPRVFMNSGEEDPLALKSARAMKSILDEAGVENQLYVDEGGHHYSFWVPNFERYLKWLAENW